MSPIDARSPDALLEQVGWIRALAQTLMRDEHAAEDLTQDTYVAALQRRPDDRRPLRGWLATVLRNLAVQHQRRARSRSTRERAAARSEESPATVDVLERAEKQRRIAEWVMALSEPYRTTVLLRFFDRLPPRDISSAMEVPIATVNSRLQRGLQMLRDRIDARSERRQAWLSTLCIPVAGPAPKLMGAVVVKSKTALLLPAGALILALGGIWFLPPEGAPPVAGSADLQVATTEGAVEVRQPLSVVEGNEREPVVTEVTVEEETETGTAILARGRVLSIGGEPLADVGVRYSPSGQGAVERLRSGLDGWFELEIGPARGILEADDDRYSTVMVAIARPEASGPCVVVVAPRLDFAGLVVDESGAAIQGAEVSIRSLQPTFGGQGMLLDASQPKPWNTRSDGAGRFELSGTPRLEDALLDVRALGFLPHRQPAPLHTDRGIQIVMRRPEVGRTGIHGIVVSPEGWLVPHAFVSHGTATGTTDAGGQFQLPLREEDRDAPLIAAVVDFQPAILPPRQSFPDEVILQLGPPPLKIQGQVVDADGEPMDDVKVWLVEPTFFGVLGRGPVWLEGLTLSPEPEFWTPASTDAEGHFEIPGLLERTYRLRALQQQTLLETTVEDVPAGTEELTIVMPTDLLAERITGTVVSLSGQLLSGIQLMHFAQTLKKAPPDGWTATAGEPGASAVSDEQGRFEFRNVPRNGMVLMAMGDNVVPDQFELDEQDLMDLRIVLEKQVHLQVELDAPIDRADEMRVLDLAGRPMEMYLLRAKRGQVNLSWAIAEGRSPVVTVGETARSVELLREGLRVALISVTLLGDDVHMIQY